MAQIDTSIPLSFQRPKLATPADVLSLKSLQGDIALKQAQVADIPRKRELERLTALKDLQKDQFTRRKELDKELSTRVFNARIVAKNRGMSDADADREMHRAYLDGIAEQEKSGLLSMAGISTEEIGQARTKLPTWDQIQSEVLTPEQALTQQEEAAALSADPVPLSQVGQGPPPVGPAQTIPLQDMGQPGMAELPEGVEEVTLPEVRTPTQTVTGDRPAATPEALRARALALDNVKGKVARERADKLRQEANRLEGRGLEEQRLAEQIKTREEQAAGRVTTAAQKVREMTAKLADDFRQEQAVKDYRTTVPIIASMESASRKDTAASDVDIVYAIAKIFDPPSVVRDQERISIVNAGGLPSEIVSMIGYVNGGQRLSDDLRQGLLAQARDRFANYTSAYEAVKQSYTDQAKRWEIDVRDVVRDYKPREQPKGDRGVAQSPKAPRVGDTVDGWRYKGGDPGKQSSWSKVQ